MKIFVETELILWRIQINMGSPGWMHVSGAGISIEVNFLKPGPGLSDREEFLPLFINLRLLNHKREARGCTLRFKW